MKVAYFLGGLNRGGAETLILDVCRQHEKVPFDLICMYRQEGNMLDEFKASGAPLIPIPKSGGLLNYILQVRRVLLREKITIVHSQTPSNTLILAVAILGTGIKIITSFHGHTFADAAWWERKIVYAASKKIICVSEYQKRYYEQKWGLPKENKLRVVYNGIDFEKLNVKSEGVNELKNDRRLKLCMVGNFIKGRSQRVICEAINILKQQELTDFDFYFIGRKDSAEPERYDECVQYCEEHQLDNVHFLGAREDVPELLKTMGGFVYSTEHDTFGIAVIEAIASGLPVVVNDWAVMEEVCDLGLRQSNKTIRFFRTEDIDDCAEKIANLLDDIQTNKNQLQTDCQQAGEKVREKYSIVKHVERLRAVYDEIVDR